jgi:hypothetical protein
MNWPLTGTQNSVSLKIIIRYTDDSRYDKDQVILMTTWLNDGKGCKCSVFATRESLQVEMESHGWGDVDGRMAVILILQEHLKSWKSVLNN